jgi:putative transposase
VKLHPHIDTVQLPKLGKIKYRNSRLLPHDAIIKQASISQQVDGWYIALCVETDIAPLPPASQAQVGIDVGIKTLATMSTGEAIANPRHLQQAQHRLARFQRSASRKKKGGNNRRKAIQKLARQHLRVRNCRRDYLHKLTTRLIHENQVIVTERLNIAGMLKNHNLAKSIADASWGELNRQLAYKSLWYGHCYEQVAPHYTSQDCSVCGYHNQCLTLAKRQWICSGCGTIHDRDKNAARNIIKKAVGHTVSACEQLSIAAYTDPLG